MSYLLKNGEQSLIVSFCTEAESALVVLATNSRQFYYEKVNDSEIMERINESESGIRLPLKKILRLLKQQPEKYEFNFGADDQLHLSLEYEIKSSYKSLELIKIYFNLEQCTTTEEVGRYFVTGLLKSLIEQSVKTDNQPMPTMTLSSSLDIRNLLNNTHINDLCKMVGKEFAVKDEEPKSEEKAAEKAGPLSSYTNVRRAYKRPIVEKEFKYANNDSQELELEEPKQIELPSTSSVKSSFNNSKANSRVKKGKVKF